MIFTYKDTYDSLIRRDAKFINILYDMPIGMVLQMDKAYLCHSLARIKLACQWLEGVLELMAERERE